MCDLFAIFPLFVLVPVAVAALTFRWIEQPSMNFAKALDARVNGTESVAGAREVSALAVPPR